jgi:hypothetical protein
MARRVKSSSSPDGALRDLGLGAEAPFVVVSSVELSDDERRGMNGGKCDYGNAQGIAQLCKTEL